jgi:hypothetical protein
MSNSQLVGSSFIDGLRAPHYVDGRLLTADDLAADQQATLTRLGWLGVAVGPGVVEGLTVSGQGNELRVEPGIGVNRSGAIFRLPGPVALALSLRAPAAESADAGRFERCRLDTGTTETGIVGGAYLLVATPASRLEGVAPVKGAPAARGNPGCVARWEVEGLQFRAIALERFDPGAFSLSGAEDERRRQASQLRSRLAHWCYGSEQLRALPRDPFGFGAAYAGLDGIGAADLTPCDLPLAVFHWTGSALTFVDLWAARRRPVRPGALDGWHAMLDDRRLAEGQARFLQFQAQLDDLRRAGAANEVQASTYFDWLPPVGLVPFRITRREELATLYRFADGLVYAGDLLEVIGMVIGRVTGRELIDRLRAAMAAGALSCAEVISYLLEDSFSGEGFNPDTFFKGIEPAPLGLISGDSLDTLVHQSWLDEAVNLHEAPLLDLLVVAEQLTDLLVERLYQLAGDDDASAKALAALARRAVDAARGANATTPVLAMARSLARGYHQALAAPKAEQPAGQGRAAFVKRFRQTLSQSIVAAMPAGPPEQIYAIFVRRTRPPFFLNSDRQDGGNNR